MKNIISMIALAGAALSNACGSAGQSADPAPSSSAALSAVQDCATQAKACAAAAKSVSDGKACGDELRACLGPLVADAGAISLPPITLPDGGNVTVPPLPPLPPITLPDGGTVTIPPIALPDAAVTGVPDPNKVQASVSACVAALKLCLSSAADPMKCADDARACLTNAI